MFSSYALLVTMRKVIRSTPPQAGPARNKKAGPAPSLSYERWAVGRLSMGERCRVEVSMSCIPLREDPICRSCFESSCEEARQGRRMEDRQ